jgi:hypothetical protein
MLASGLLRAVPSERLFNITSCAPTRIERMYGVGMQLRRTEAGWEEPRPRVCKACGGALGPNTVLVGIIHCRCGLHRTHFCRTCGTITFSPTLGDNCRLRSLDNRE